MRKELERLMKAWHDLAELRALLGEWLQEYLRDHEDLRRQTQSWEIGLDLTPDFPALRVRVACRAGGATWSNRFFISEEKVLFDDQVCGHLLFRFEESLAAIARNLPRPAAPAR